MASGTRGQTKRTMEAVAAPAAPAAPAASTDGRKKKRVMDMVAAPAASTDGRKKKRVMDVVVAPDDVRKKVEDKKVEDKKEDEEKYVYPTECWPGTDRLICFEPPYEPTSPLFYPSYDPFVVDPSFDPSFDLMN